MGLRLCAGYSAEPERIAQFRSPDSAATPTRSVILTSINKIKMKFLLEAMRMFHYMVGITAPRREDEKKILFLWIGVVVGLVLLGAGVAFFLIPRIIHKSGSSTTLNCSTAGAVNLSAGWSRRARQPEVA
jgi:uncharacterized membrane protein YczE